MTSFWDILNNLFTGREDVIGVTTPGIYPTEAFPLHITLQQPPTIGAIGAGAGIGAGAVLFFLFLLS